MGLLDSMFGGGTGLSLSLDRPQGSPGGVVGGNVLLVGGKKPLKLTTLRVHLLYVCVESQDEGFPKIDTRVIGEQVIAAGIDLAPGGQYPFSFRLTIPGDTYPSAHNTSYRVQVVADIPGVKDPSAEQDLKVVPAEANAHFALPMHEVIARFPGLQAHDEETLCNALQQLFLECYSNGGQYMEAEPMLAHYMQHPSLRVKRSALQAWANLVDNRVQPQHLQSLYAIANTPGLDPETFDEVIRSACKFAEEGALPMVQQLVTNPSPHVRKVTAESLRFHAASRFPGKRELLMQLIGDADASVRAAAVMAMADFREDPQIMYGVANHLDRDQDPNVQAACIGTLSLGHHHGFGDLVLSVYEKHASNPNAKVREAIAESLHWQPEAAVQRVWGIAQRLCQDELPAVRRSMAFQFINMERFPQLLPLAQHLAENDPNEDVRADAIRGMSRMAPPAQYLGYLQHKLSQNPSKDTLWSIISALRDHSKERNAQALLTQIGQHPDPDIASAARDAMS